MTIDVKADETYLFQLIEGDTGIRCPVFVSTPEKLCDYLAEKKVKLFVLTLIHVNDDPDIGNLDLFMRIPVYSSHSWIATFAPHLLPKAVELMEAEKNKDVEPEVKTNFITRFFQEKL